MDYTCIIVGAGAAGLSAAVRTASAGHKTLILEHMDAAGKKLLMTGNGDCNLAPANRAGAAEGLLCPDPAFLGHILEQFSVEDEIAFFEQRGIQIIEKRGGLYPLGGGAHAVLDVLLLECERLGVELRYGVGIRHIRPIRGGLQIETKDGYLTAETVLLATGGKSYRKTGSDGSGFLYLDELGHEATPISPGLVPLLTDDALLARASGVRIQSELRLLTNGDAAVRERGELQITDSGVSGICVFNLSLYYVPEHTTLMIDFLPDYPAAKLLGIYEALFQQPQFQNRCLGNAFLGLLPPRLSEVVIERAGLSREIACSEVSQEALKHLIDQMKNYKLKVTGTRGFDHAQVTRGGVRLSQVDPKTMMSKKTQGVFFAGEMLDVAGRCGGYNLYFAFASGQCAGESISRYVENHRA